MLQNRITGNNNLAKVNELGCCFKSCGMSTEAYFDICEIKEMFHWFKVHNLCVLFIDGCYYYNHESNSATPFIVEDVNSYLHTLNELKNMSLTLEHEHRIYQRQLARETKYGSK